MLELLEGVRQLRLAQGEHGVPEGKALPLAGLGSRAAQLSDPAAQPLFSAIDVAG